MSVRHDIAWRLGWGGGGGGGETVGAGVEYLISEFARRLRWRKGINSAIDRSNSRAINGPGNGYKRVLDRRGVEDVHEEVQREVQEHCYECTSLL